MSLFDESRLRAAASHLHREVGHDQDAYRAVAREYLGDDSTEAMQAINDKVVEMFGHDYQLRFV